MTPKMRSGKVEMVSVEWLLNNVIDSVDDVCDMFNNVDFERLLQTKSIDPQFGAIVNAIVTQGFRIPIVIIQSNYTGHRLSFGNGHHRFAAAVLLALDEIPVFWSHTDDFMCSDVSEEDDWDESDEGDFEDLAWMCSRELVF